MTDILTDLMTALVIAALISAVMTLICLRELQIEQPMIFQIFMGMLVALTILLFGSFRVMEGKLGCNND